MKGILKRFISFEFKNEIIEETEFEIKSMYAFGKKMTALYLVLKQLFSNLKYSICFFNLI